MVNTSQVSEKVVHCNVTTVDTNDNINLSIVYELNTTNERRKLWDDLRRLHGGISGPWLLMGYLNSVYHPHNRLNGHPVTEYEIQDMCGFMEELHLSPLDASVWGVIRKRKIREFGVE